MLVFSVCQFVRYKFAIGAECNIIPKVWRISQNLKNKKTVFSGKLQAWTSLNIEIFEQIFIFQNVSTVTQLKEGRGWGFRTITCKLNDLCYFFPYSRPPPPCSAVSKFNINFAVMKNFSRLHLFMEYIWFMLYVITR